MDQNTIASRLTDSLQHQIDNFKRKFSYCNNQGVEEAEDKHHIEVENKNIIDYHIERLHQQQQQQQQLNNNRRTLSPNLNNSMCLPKVLLEKNPTTSTKAFKKTSPHNDNKDLITNRYYSRRDLLGWSLLAATLCAALLVSGASGAEEAPSQSALAINKILPEARATQASVDRQVSSPNQQPVQSASASPPAALSAPTSSSSGVSKPTSAAAKQPIATDSKPTAAKQATVASKLASLASAAKDKSSSKHSLAAQQQNYDKYQLKASPFSRHQDVAAAAAAAAAEKSSPVASSSAQSDQSSNEHASKHQDNSNKSSSDERPPKSSSGSSLAATSSSGYKKSAGGKLQAASGGQSSFSLLKRILPSFMTSATAAAAVAASAVANNNNNNHGGSPNSRSSLAGAGLSGADLGSNAIPTPLMNKISNKLIDYLASHSKKSAAMMPMMDKSSSSSSIVSLLRNPLVKSSGAGINDRQAGPAATGLASLLSNPLGLGLLFSAPLIPSLLLTPLALAGLSPAMSAINNLFNDDDDEQPAKPLGANGQPLSGGANQAGPLMNSPFGALLGASSSPLANFLQNSGIGTASGGSGSGADGSAGSGTQPGSFALQAMQSFLGPTSTTERPLFNPGMFASAASGGVQQAIGNALSGSSSSGSSSSGSSSSSSGLSASGSSPIGSILSPSGSPIRSFFSGGGGGGGGSGGLMQAAASFIAPSFASPGSSSSNSAASAAAADDDKSLLQMASDVFEKVSNFIDTDKSDVAQASGSSSNHHQSMSNNPFQSSPISALVGLSNFSPFQLSSLLSATPFGSSLIQPAATSGGGGAAAAGAAAAAASGAAAASPIKQQRAGFFGTLKNIYELFSSSFLRRQEVGSSLDASNECQQRLICELHQKAMNSKLFRRSVQSNLMELAQLDRNLQEQIKLAGPMSARVDADTKAMLSDFLKASNGFKQGRELVSCSKMFPKCSRSMLFSFANTHLGGPSGLMTVASMGDSASSKAIGKFSNLMKKMKFKSIQQHQQQWKLRKPGKSNSIPRVVPSIVSASSPSQLQPILSAPAVAAPNTASQAVAFQIPTNNVIQQQQQQPATLLSLNSMPMLSEQDYLQVAPLSKPGQQAQSGQLNPVDSLKIAQQILMYQQQQQQQQPQYSQPMQPQQQQQQIDLNNGAAASSIYGTTNYQGQYVANQQPSIGSYNQLTNNQKPVIYTDAIGMQQPASSGISLYSTDSPYYASSQQQQLGDMQQPQQQQQMRPMEQQLQAQQPQQQQLDNSQQINKQMPTSVNQQQQQPQSQQYSTRSGSAATTSQQMTTPVMMQVVVKQQQQQQHHQSAIPIAVAA